ncbi:NADP-dependent isocitrate dehydrogenase [Marinobacter persicus]|uniref:Isocitrate dehydrogenase [NADP] n=1 Tax=Marinobacter persicus TaxID=930118 RepID=A0A2S6GA73_9GAMM|nr:NADP-dependent isocitrate dehydrogenase [Marinobacter persicus]KXS53017.1 MAG: isocitrate dehydrogenase [Marinobacter sp. T13-3]PPK53395.1 isocitrate dehydrogenase [Marinobacter persicus]PPK56232.1 isocitrate dehydrogenase [Marinobacter persicus]PPK59827.1 isocitrate dehydrogenase [Marinobacter persicus]
MTDSKAKIVYTLTDEAPALATRSLLPILETFAKPAGIDFETSDISLAARILATFPDYLEEDQRVPDALAQLGEFTKDPNANIIKLPNISASVPQLNAAIKELNAQGYKVPEYTEEPKTDEEKDVKARYAKVLGSAVNPVLREGNSDRRAPAAVKAFARKHPHSMGEWSADSKTHVAHMEDGDFYSAEQSVTLENDTTAQIVFENAKGEKTILKSELPLMAGEVLDSTFMSKKALLKFFDEQIEDCKKNDIMFSLHLKATMMKVSDPVIFGYAVKSFYKELFEKYGDLFEELGVTANNGVSSVEEKIQQLPEDKQNEIKQDLAQIYKDRPEIAMVDSDNGITNLHVPSDVIVDASMPAMIRSSGKMWDSDGGMRDTKAVLPDRSYATIYQETIDFCKKHGAFDPTTMGTVPNVGLMAQKAEEYGSHDKTFILKEAGTVRVIADDKVLMEHQVEEGDIWRACQTKDIPIRDWVKLAVNRSRASGMPAIFWLDSKRAHDAELIKKVEAYLKEHDTDGLDIRIMAPVEAINFTMERMIRGEDTISVTGNVLRDYLTDLFPILELGTSAKMLSIVPLLNGGGLYETGAGGSAPKHVQQLVKENHLRWDSLGEFLAVAVSLEELGEKHDNARARLLGQTLDTAVGQLLENNESPSRKAGELDNRGSHFHLACHWAAALAEQNDDQDLKAFAAKFSEKLEADKDKILEELTVIQGKPADIGGYYHAPADKVCAVMQPSETLNKILTEFAEAAK